jgi:hypothetical protein
MDHAPGADKLTARDHKNLDAFLGHVLDAHKDGTLSRADARSCLAQVIGALDAENYGRSTQLVRRIAGAHPRRQRQSASQARKNLCVDRRVLGSPRALCRVQTRMLRLLPDERANLES